ncbi:MAG: hypothetical protein HFH06_00005 [Lachnospiraceae bacterium]|nr:hypothetical protein [Lachnospiraceae bacterium]
MEIREMRNIIGFTLEEILIASPYQHQGIGSWLLNELEHKVSEKAHLYWNYWLLTMICMNITMEKLIIIRRQILFQEQSGCNKFRLCAQQRAINLTGANPVCEGLANQQ